jgi:hypothetical protein
MGQDNFTRMCMVNPGPPLFQVGEQVCGNEYGDDVAIWSGELRIYIKRHIIRTIKEAGEAVGSMADWSKS